MHALKQFSYDWPDLDNAWFHYSNYLGFLSVQNEEELLQLIERADKMGIKYSIFFEPDRDYETTAITLEPGKQTKRLLSKLPLALK